MLYQWLDWPAPANVKACYTLRTGGASLAPYNHFNVANHVGDEPKAVARERMRLAASLGFGSDQPFCWLKQVHGVEVVEAASIVEGSNDSPPEADACFTQKPHVVCTVMTADCLPVFFCDSSGRQVAVAHGGWRGLLQGVLQATVARFSDPNTLLAYLGPAIGQAAFEIGDEVRQQFIEHYPATASCFIPGKPGKWYGDLYAIARQLLLEVGVSNTYGGERCTYSEADAFYSYRRDGVTGRMAHLIWLT